MTNDTDTESVRIITEVARKHLGPGGVRLIENHIEKGWIETARDFILNKLSFYREDEELHSGDVNKIDESIKILSEIKDRPPD